jgi:predicted Zn-dependent peptidase
MKIKKLENNMPVILAPIQGTKTTTVLVIVKTGSKYENKNNNGISHFLEHMFFKGTKKRPTTFSISSELDAIGADFNAFTGKECTGYWIKTTEEKTNIALDMISDMFLNSKFSSQEINREKGVILEELNMYEDNPMMKIDDVFESCLYGNTPAGWDTIGTKKNITNFTRKDFIDYYKKQYTANNTTIIIAGKIKKNITKDINIFFKKINKGENQKRDDVIENQKLSKVKISYKKTDQVVFSLGVRTFPANSKEEFPLKILSILLGGSMSSRLFIEVRERRGLGYYVKTNNQSYTDCGYMTTQAGVTKSRIKEAIKVILEEYKKTTQKIVSQKELNKIKDLIIGKITLQLESSDNVASWYGQQIIYKDDLTSPEEFIKKIKKVTSQDIKKIARKIFVEKNLNLAIIGPFKDEKIFQKLLKL